MGIKVGERQFFAVDDTLASELDIGVHRAPAIRLEFVHRQDLVCRLLALCTASFWLVVRVGTDQRPEVSEQQLVGHQRAAELGPRLTGNVSQVAVDVAAADLAVELFIGEFRAGVIVQLGDEMTIGGVRRRVRQSHSGQRIEVTKAVTGQFQAQVEGAEVERVGQGAGQFNAGIADVRLGLQRERFARILQGQQPADFALTTEILAVILTFHL